MRFVAALLVLLLHVGDMLPGHPLSDAVGSAGYVGVTFFFVLSGFVLTVSYRHGSSLRHFYRRRVARLYPVHIVTLGLAVPILLFEGSGIPPGPIVANALLVQAWIPRQDYYYGGNGVSWSIACEAFFYLLLPALLVFTRRMPRARLAVLFITVLTAVIAIAGVTHMLVPTAETTPYLWVFPAYRLGEFVLGVVLGVHYLRRSQRPVAHPARTLWVAGILTVVCYVAASAVHSELDRVLVSYPPQDVASLVMLPGVLVLIPALAEHERSGRHSWLGSSVLVSLGRWSFSLYMTHQLVIRVVRRLLDGATFDPVPAAGLQAAVVALCIAVAAATYRFVERPLERRLRGDTPSAGPDARPDGVIPLPRSGAGAPSRSRGRETAVGPAS